MSFIPSPLSRSPLSSSPLSRSPLSRSPLSRLLHCAAFCVIFCVVTSTISLHAEDKVKNDTSQPENKNKPCQKLLIERFPNPSVRQLLKEGKLDTSFYNRLNRFGKQDQVFLTVAAFLSQQGVLDSQTFTALGAHVKDGDPFFESLASSMAVASRADRESLRRDLREAQANHPQQSPLDALHQILSPTSDSIEWKANIIDRATVLWTRVTKIISGEATINVSLYKKMMAAAQPQWAAYAMAYLAEDQGSGMGPVLHGQTLVSFSQSGSNLQAWRGIYEQIAIAMIIQRQENPDETSRRLLKEMAFSGRLQTLYVLYSKVLNQEQRTDVMSFDDWARAHIREATELWEAVVRLAPKS